MNKNLSSYKGEVKKVIGDYFLPVFNKKLEEQAALIKSFDDAVKGLMSKNYLEISKEEAMRSFCNYKEKIEVLVKDQLKNELINDFDKEFDSFNTNMILFIERIDEVLIRDQKPERFKILSEDRFLIKTGKRFKQLFRNIAGWPLATANLFRKLLGRASKQRAAASHQIKLRNLARYFLKEKLSASLSEQIDTYFKTVTKTSRLIWQVDEQIDHVIDNFISEGNDITLPVELSQKIPDGLEAIDKCKGEISKLSFEQLENHSNSFVESSYRVGTFELSNRKFGASKTAKLHYRLNQGYANKNKNWNNTLLILSDDWEIDIELYAMIYHGLESFYHNCSKVEDRINKKIRTEVKGIITEIEKCKKSVSEVDSKGSKKKIESVLSDQLKAISTIIESRLIPQANEVILSQGLPSLINGIEASLSEDIQNLSDRRAVVKGAEYDAPVRKSAISYIAPRELINFESWPRFQQAAKNCKVQITAKINELQQELSQLGQIAAFNLESALSLINDDENKNDPLDVAIEGLTRTINKAESLDEFIQEIKKAVNSDLLLSLQKFNSSLVKFTDNENIYEIRVRIAKAKAIERSKRLREAWVRRIKNLGPIVWKSVKTNYSKANDLIIEVFKRYGLSKEKTVISTEIADFLAETQAAIEKLPFVYQRLFKSVPLNDNHLFEGRQAEINELNGAYNNFMKGRFAATVLVGEKGTGITTLLNFFSQELTTSCDVQRFDTLQIVDSTDDLTDYFSERFDKKFKSLDEFAAFLNNGSKKIIILENTQKHFLKKVHGFESISHLLELISLTSKNVFWLTTCTSYAWNYLDKTIKISDHYGYKINMREFEDEVITKIIMKRHQVSGYNLQFEPSSTHLNNKKFKKLDEKEQQKQLHAEFFNDLNDIAKSNVSLALVYWLRSTSEVSDNTIHISSLRDLDFAFMNSLPLDKLYALTNLLFHDGLSEEDFYKCMNKDVIGGRALLYPLFEDGILVKKNEAYLINPLLYRQTVALLKTKNIIH